MYIIEALVAKGAKIVAYDPEAMENVKGVFGNKIEYVENQYDALADADALLIATEWGTFKNPDFDKLKSSLKTPTIFDGRNLYSLEQMEKLGFYYNSLGRQTVRPYA